MVRKRDVKNQQVTGSRLDIRSWSVCMYECRSCVCVFDLVVRVCVCLSVYLCSMRRKGERGRGWAWNEIGEEKFRGSLSKCGWLRVNIGNLDIYLPFSVVHQKNPWFYVELIKIKFLISSYFNLNRINIKSRFFPRSV